jgi:hypothetical protein
MPNAQRYLPSPAQIRAECARIRESWDELEYYRRAGRLVPWYLLEKKQRVAGKSSDWQPPRGKLSAEVPVSIT